METVFLDCRLVSLMLCGMLDITTCRASCDLLSAKSLELRSLILLFLEEAFSLFSTGGQAGADAQLLR